MNKEKLNKLMELNSKHFKDAFGEFTQEKENNFNEKVGEYVYKPSFNEVFYNVNQKEFMFSILQRLKENKNINLLFSGLAGTGKTFSAKMLACETKRPFVYILGSLGKQKIVDMLLNLKANSIVLIDEIHNIPEKIAEVIYPAVEYNEIYLDGRCYKLNNPLFIGTTTEPERLPKPLLDRFLRIEFEEPDVENTIKILKSYNLNEECINLLLKYSNNIRILKKIINTIDAIGERDLKTLLKVFSIMKINKETGMSEEQEKYLLFLKSSGKQSLRNIGFYLRRSEEYIKEDIEPELIRKDLIIISSRGRELKNSVI